MKRIKAACLEQTIHFQLKEAAPPPSRPGRFRTNTTTIKPSWNAARLKFRIVEETPQPDGSLLVRIKKQVSAYDCGDYLD